MPGQIRRCGELSHDGANGGVFFPDQGDRGTHVSVNGVGVVATAPNPDNAVAS
ncbi:MAG: hypothetical protein ACFB12_01685 [Leptolyngbyaceae cyanobacterium]